jgi:hypothetical protein
MGAIKARGLGVGQLPQHARIAGALPADTFADVMKVDADIFYAVYVMVDLIFAHTIGSNLALDRMDSYNETATSQTFPRNRGNQA